jgi:hypothetical protein
MSSILDTATSQKQSNAGVNITHFKAQMGNHNMIVHASLT